MARGEAWISEARSRLRVGDLFEWPAIVITIETNARAHGAISKEAIRRAIPLPSLELGECRHTRLDDRDYVFACLWAPGSEYDDALVRQLSRGALHEASRGHLPELAFPLFGGSESHRFIEVMVNELLRASHRLEKAGHHVPEALLVTREALIL